MSSKTVAFKQPAPLPKPAEDWITQSGEGPTPSASKLIVPTKRLTADVPEELHRRLKVHCAMNGTNITDVLVYLLAKEFPVT